MPKTSKTCRLRLLSEGVCLNTIGEEQRRLLFESQPGDDKSDTYAKLEWIVPPEVADDFKVGTVLYLILRPVED